MFVKQNLLILMDQSKQYEKEKKNMNKFKPNEVVKLIRSEGVKGGKIGDIGVTVDGRGEFPDLYKKLKKRFEKIGTSYADEFVWVKWLAPFPYRPDKDGAYHHARFEVIKSAGEA
jgi:hypothetical protein